MWSWGECTNGQLGDRTNIDNMIPHQLGTETNWNTVYTTMQHSFGTKTDFTLWSWGNNANGQLGNGTNENKNTPNRI